MRPVLRWAGSKYRLLNLLSEAAPSTFGKYFEPFVGSATFFLRLDPARATLGDVNPHLVATYRTIRARPHVVHRRLSDLPRTKKMYYVLRETEPSELASVDRAVRFMYLNQFCFNGVYRENQYGEFNVPRGKKFRTLPTEEEYTQFASRLRNAELRCGDFEETLEGARENDFVYLDPPYAKRRARNRGEYGSDAFGTSDVSRLIDTMLALDHLGVYVMASFFDSTLLRRALFGWRFRTLAVARSVSGFTAKRRSVRELLITNYCSRSVKTDISYSQEHSSASSPKLDLR
jgi:DNA adenine methylase